MCNVTSSTVPALPASLRGVQAAVAQKGAAAPSALGLPQDSNLKDMPFKDAKEKLIEAFERQYLIDLIERHSGNISKAARAADMDRKSIARLMRKHGINR